MIVDLCRIASTSSTQRRFRRAACRRSLSHPPLCEVPRPCSTPSDAGNNHKAKSFIDPYKVRFVAAPCFVSGRADLCALARPHPADPYFTLHAGAHYGYRPQPWPVQYEAGKEQAYTLAERYDEEQAELRQAATPIRPQTERRDAAE